MQITLSPMRRDDRLTLARAGDTLTINGEVFDFSGIPDGTTLPAEAVDCPWIAADVERVAGVLRITLILPHGASAPQETLFPAPMIDPPDGPIALPSHSEEPENAQD